MIAAQPVSSHQEAIATAWPPSVTLCVINHNGARHLPASLGAIGTQTMPLAEILLVDDASTDDSIPIALHACPGLRVIRLARNAGPGAARNAGFQAARHDLILFVDNDVQLEATAAACLVARWRSRPGTLAVAPRVLYAETPGIVQFDSADCHFLGLMATRNADRRAQDLDDEAALTTSLVTASFLIDRARWQGVRPFDESMGFNLEDHDFGVRARLAGHSVWIEPKARARHGSGTPGLSYRPGMLPTPQRLFYLTRNRWIVITKCYSTRTLALLAPALLLFELMQFAWLASQGHPGVWWRACGSYLRRFGALRASRAATQRLRTVRDGTILRDAPLPLTRHARSGLLGRYLAPCADRMLRGYWQRVRGLV